MRNQFAKQFSVCVIFVVEGLAMLRALSFILTAFLVLAAPLWAAAPPRCFEDQGEQICVPSIESGAGLSSAPSAKFFYPAFIESKLNKGAGFSGPNCYHAALVATGALPESERRYIGSAEFELILQNSFRPVSEVERQPGDLVVFDAKASRSHAAVLFGRDLIFQKKGYLRHYLYRIVPLNETMSDEAGEWMPGPFDQGGGNHELYLNSAPRMFYRKKGGIGASGQVGAELPQLELVSFIKRAVLESAPAWKVGRELGLVTEELIPALVTEVSALSQSVSFEARLAYETLRSLGDQVFQSIEESHFSSRLSENRRARINSEICFQENAYLRELVIKLLRLLRLSGREPSSASVEAVLVKLRAANRSECRINLLQEASSLE
ncbi:hypothetical protein WDW86_04385 [Bdellovibrionota bacterium FG-2]